MEASRNDAQGRTASPVPNLTAALAYAARGWPVLPLHSITVNGCSCASQSCSSPAKHPRTHNGLKAATTSEDTIRTWWAQWPLANIGIRTGRVSGLVVIDVDDPKSMPLLAKNGEIPKSLRVKTGKGLHLYFQAPAEPLRPRTAIIPGIDVRADDSYVVAPPSVHASGVQYSFVKADTALAPMPDWLVTLATGSGVNAFVSESAVFAEGERNARLTKTAGWLVRQGVTGDPLEAILATTNAEACDPPLSPDEVERVARSVERYRARGLAPVAPLALKRARNRFQLFSVEEVLTQPSPQWRVEGLLPVEALSMIYSPQAQFKTFFALDLALCVGHGIPFHGQKVKQGPVVYILGEGRGGLKNRIRAWLHHHRLSTVDAAHFVLAAVQFGNANDITDLRMQIDARNVRPAMVFIDTFARSAVGLDENDAMQVGLWIDAVTRLKDDLGCDVVAVHHAQKPRADGGAIRERGSSAFIGAVDTVIRLHRKTKTSKTVTISCEKQKDAEEFTEFKLRAEKLDLGLNEHGVVVMSCVLVPTNGQEGWHDELAGQPNDSELLALNVLAKIGDSAPGQWRKEIEESQGGAVPEGTFRHWREELEKDEFVENVGTTSKPLYRATPEGHAIVAAIGTPPVSFKDPRGASHATHTKGVAGGIGRRANGHASTVTSTGRGPNEPVDDLDLFGGGRGE